jgi:putative thioredoxin
MNILILQIGVKSIYIEAIGDLMKKNFPNALEKFIKVIKENKSYDDEGARKACIAIFKYLGEENEITLKYRRDFGRALYV